MKRIVTIFVILLFVISLLTPVSADKIQDGDEWTYTSNGVDYNESALKIVQYKGFEGDLVNHKSLAIVDTDRLFSFPTQFPGVNLTMQNDGVLYMTQEGGLPVFGNHTLTGEMFLQNQWISVNETPTYKIEPNPAETFVTAETVSYTRYARFDDLMQHENVTSEVYIKEDFVISTNQGSTEPIRNYTQTRITLEKYPLNLSSNPLSLNSIETTKITWNAEFSQPTYIGQTEPQEFVTGEGFSLSQQDNFVEYFLVISEESQADELSLMLFTLVPLALLPILMVRRNKKVKP